MRIVVNLKKGYFLAVVIGFLLLAGIFVVYAYGTNNPSQFGHTISEILAPKGCSPGQALVKNSTDRLTGGTVWRCGNIGNTTVVPPAPQIKCDWSGWKGAMTFTVQDGKKYAQTYYTTIWKCENGYLNESKYLLCQTANQPPYNAGIDCSE